MIRQEKFQNNKTGEHNALLIRVEMNNEEKDVV